MSTVRRATHLNAPAHVKLPKRKSIEADRPGAPDVRPVLTLAIGVDVMAKAAECNTPLPSLDLPGWEEYAVGSLACDRHRRGSR